VNKRGPRSAFASRVSAQDVADKAGVSISAVSRTFTAGASVSARMRARVEAAAAALGFRPNHAARSLVTGRTELIGLVSNHFANPAFLDVFDQFTRQLQARGLRPLLANLAERGGADAALEMMLKYNVDAVMIATSAPPPGFAERCVLAGLPVIHLFGRIGGPAAVPAVTVDNVRAGADLGVLMFSRGLRRLAFLGASRTDVASRDRCRGFERALGKLDCTLAAKHFTGDYSHEHGRLGLHALLDASPDIDGVFCADDALALGAMDACRERGIAVPGCVSIVGFDDMPLAAWPAYRLTTVRQPIAAMIEQAVVMLTAWLAEPLSVPVPRIFDTELIERDSLAAHAAITDRPSAARRRTATRRR
jgi:DNA-binding LacI/PurR family transcriptional regulator